MIIIKLKNLNNNPDEKRYYLYAETAFNHQGSHEYLFKMIDAASKANVDGIKFQIFLDLDEAYLPETQIYKDFSSMKFTKDEWIEIFQYAKKKKLEVIVLPLENTTIDFCKQNNQFLLMQQYCLF